MDTVFSESDSMLLHDILMLPDHEVEGILGELISENACVSFGVPMVDLACDEMKWQREYICIDSAFRIARS
jgi:hypothetical protein